MMDIESFKQLALSFPDVTEEPHFDKTSFRIKKKIFATLSKKDNRISLKLSEVDQSVFCSIDKSIIYPVPNKWGRQGWTQVELKQIKKSILKDLLQAAYHEVKGQ
jgi:predicted DNA-binding protein (MmcQ/YjbR family)